MSNPTVTAIVSAEDRASAVLRAVAQMADKVAKDLEKAGNSADFSKVERQINAATAAADRHANALNRARDAFKGLLNAAHMYAAYQFPHIAAEAVREYIPIDRLRTQNQAAGGYGDKDRKALVRQEQELADRWGMKPEDTIHAQGEYIKRHMSAATTQAMTEEAAKLGKALDVSVDKAARILEGMIFGTGQHVTTPEEAHRLGKHFGDIAATQSKMGAMSPEDIEAGWKYAAAAVTAAHISPETAAAAQMILKREQFGGDESGVFLRQLGARVMLPTNEGRVALAAAGIKYDQYVGPGQMKTPGLNLAFAEKGLHELSAKHIAEIQKAYDSGKVGSLADFQRLVRAAYQSEHPGAKAKDLNTVGKVSGNFYDASKGQVDGEKLWHDMLKNMTPQQILQYLGVKQGAKGVSLIQQLKAEQDYEDLLHNSGGRAQHIAEEKMNAMAAAYDRFTANLEAARNSFVEANAGVLKGMFNLGSDLAKFAEGLSDQQKKYLVALGAAGAALGALKGASWFKDLAGALSGKNLDKSAVALTHAAHSLEVAAGKLGTGAHAPGGGKGSAAIVNGPQGGSAREGEHPAAKPSRNFDPVGLGLGSLLLPGFGLGYSVWNMPTDEKGWNAQDAANQQTQARVEKFMRDNLPSWLLPEDGSAPGEKKAKRWWDNLGKQDPKSPDYDWTEPPAGFPNLLKSPVAPAGGLPTFAQVPGAQKQDFSSILQAINANMSKPAKVETTPLQGTLTGSATLGVNISPSPLFVARMDEIKAIAMSAKVAAQGTSHSLGPTLSGPTGVQK